MQGEMCVGGNLKVILKHFTHSHIKFIIHYYAQLWSRLLCNMMCTPAQSQVWFGDVFDGVVLSRAAIFIVSMTALMMSDPFCQLCLDVHWVVGNKEEWNAFIHLCMRLHGEFNVGVHFNNTCKPRQVDKLGLKPHFVLSSRFYSSPYSISTNRMIAQTSITPFIAASPVTTYQVSLVC